MVEYILILFTATSMVASGDSMALTSVPGFKTKQECEVAGKQTSSFGTLYKNVKFVCVAQTK